MIIFFCRRFQDELFGSPVICNCHAKRCICWVLVFASSKYFQKLWFIYLPWCFIVELEGIVRTEQPTKCLNHFRNWGRGWARKLITDRSNAVFLLWFSFACFCVGFGDVSPYVYTNYFSSVYETEWSPFGKELPARLTLCSLFWFWGRDLGSDWLVPGHCLLVAVEKNSSSLEFKCVIAASMTPCIVNLTCPR